MTDATQQPTAEPHADDFQVQLRRLRIVEAAEPVFREKGIEAATVQDLLDSAGISRGTFYRYFGSKEDVVVELYSFASQQMFSSIMRAVAFEKTANDKIRKALDVYLGVHAQAGETMRVMSQEASRPSSRLYAMRQTMIDSLTALFDDGVFTEQGRRIHPVIFQVLINGIETVSNYLLTETECTPADLEIGRQAMYSIVEHVLAQPGDEITPLPLRSETDD